MVKDIELLILYLDCLLGGISKRKDSLAPVRLLFSIKASVFGVYEQKVNPYRI